MGENEVKEVFKLFDQDGQGIKIKEIGTVLRSLGLATTEAQLKNYVAEATKKDKNYVQFNDFLVYVREQQKVEAQQSTGDIASEMQGMKTGILHFFDKLSTKQIRESPPKTVKI